MKIALAQIKPVTGDLEGNALQIIAAVKRAVAEKADLIVFPETAVTGYCCGALFDSVSFVKANADILKNKIAVEVPDDLAAVVGFVDYKGTKKDGYPRISSSAAVIQGQKIVNIYDKIILASDNHHEDKKYFTPGREVLPAEINVDGKSVVIGTPVCEDSWSFRHERDVVAEMKDKGAKLIVCINQSYFSYGKQELRRKIFQGHAKEKKIPVVSVNAAGVGDIVKNIMIYDGGSLCFGADGNQLAELKRFSRDFRTVEVNPDGASSVPSCSGRNLKKYEEIFEALVFEQRELFKVLGLKKAQIHLSGGVDSGVVACIAREALGPENTVLISNPTGDNSGETRGFAAHIARELGVDLYWNFTQQVYEKLIAEHEESFNCKASPLERATAQAVLRTAQGLCASHHFGSGIVATGNHTEIALGWATFHDIGSIGVHAPIGDLTKLEVYCLADYINSRAGREIIPKVLYDGTVKPMAELADSREDPFDYYVVSGICAEIIRHRKTPAEIVEDYRLKRLTPDFFPPNPRGLDVYSLCSEEEFAVQVEDVFRRSKLSVYKSAQGAPTVIISPRSRGFSTRETIINNYTGR